MSVTKTPVTPVPLYLLCGPLGAGKTTLLLQLLKHWQQRGVRAGVLMNEAGAVSVDGPLAVNLVEDILEISDGCVCCDARDEIAWGLKELVVECRVDVVVLECCGMAQVGDVIDGITEPGCRPLVELVSVIGVIQPGSMPEGQVSATRYSDYVRYANEIVLNKRDLCSPDEWERFRTALVGENRKARLWQTSHAKVDPSVMLQANSSFRKPCLASMRHEVGQGRVFSHSSFHPMVATISLPRPLNRGRFLEWFERLPDAIERVKGFCRFDDSDALHEVQFSRPPWRWVGTIQFRKEPEHALVLIGQGHDWKQCGDALQSCLVETDPDLSPFRVSGVGLKAGSEPVPWNLNRSYT